MDVVNMTNNEISREMDLLTKEFEEKKEKIIKLCNELDKLNEEYKKLSTEIKNRQGEQQ